MQPREFQSGQIPFISCAKDWSGKLFSWKKQNRHIHWLGKHAKKGLVCALKVSPAQIFICGTAFHWYGCWALCVIQQGSADCSAWFCPLEDDKLGAFFICWLFPPHHLSHTHTLFFNSSGFKMSTEVPWLQKRDTVIGNMSDNSYQCLQAFSS